MAADLHLHILTDEFTEEHYRCFMSSTIGSKYFEYVGKYKEMDLYGKISEGCWIGEVSWLKAALLEDSDTFIPNTVMVVHEIVGEHFPRIDEDLITEILRAFHEENTTSYALNDKDEVEKWLREHMGERLFTVSW